MNTDKPIQVLAVSSGKGGVGKTNISINLALALAQRQKQVALLDADMGLANVDVLLNLRPLRNLSHVIEGQCDLKDVIVQGPHGIQIIPSASGISSLANLSEHAQSDLIHQFSYLNSETDFLIIDTSAGLTPSVLNFCQAAHEILIVICNEPASIADAYAMIKVLSQEYQVERFRIVVNRVDSEQEAHQLYQRLLKVTQKYLEVILRFSGMIPEDRMLVQSVRQQRPVISAHPRAASSIAFKKLAEHADNWPVTKLASGKIEFFFERMLDYQGVVETRAAL